MSLSRTMHWTHDKHVPSVGGSPPPSTQGTAPTQGHVMNALLEALDTDTQEFVALRKDLHSHPELSFEEHRTSDLVALRLTQWGYRVERGLAGTGVVGQIKRDNGTRHIGIRAEMDA